MEETSIFTGKNPNRTKRDGFCAVNGLGIMARICWCISVIIMTFLDDMEDHTSCLQVIRMQQEFGALVELVFVAFRILNIVSLIPVKNVLEVRLHLGAQQIEDILSNVHYLNDDDLTLRAKQFNHYDVIRHPNKGIWISQEHAMLHALKSVPVDLQEDVIWVDTCMRFFSHVLAPNRRGNRVIEASIFLLKLGVGFIDIVVPSEAFSSCVDSPEFQPTIRAIHSMTRAEKEAFLHWLDTLDSTHYPEEDPVDDFPE
jgi:hypothetical protein